MGGENEPSQLRGHSEPGENPLRRADDIGGGGQGAPAEEVVGLPFRSPGFTPAFPHGKADNDEEKEDEGNESESLHGVD